MDVRRLIKRRVSVDEVHNEQSQYLGAATFAYKASKQFAPPTPKPWSGLHTSSPVPLMHAGGG